MTATGWNADRPRLTTTGKSEIRSVLKLLATRNLGMLTHAKEWQLPRMLWLSKGRGLEPKFKKKCSKSFSFIHDGLFVARSCTDKSIGVYRTDGTALKYVPFDGQWKDAALGLVNPLDVGGSAKTRHYKPCLYVLTSKCLLIVDTIKGSVIHTIELDSFPCKFVNMLTDLEGRSLALRSTKCVSSSNQSDSLVTFAFFEVPALTFKRTLQVRKSVFGGTLVDAQVSESMLLAMHRGEIIKLYDLESCTTQQCGPCLYTVKSLHNYLVIGGYPWSALTRSKGLFHVSNLVSGAKVDGPELKVEEELGSFQVTFHPDGSSRILLLHDASIQIFTMCHRQDEQLILAKGPCYSYAPDRVPSTSRMTSSGRPGERCYYEGADRELHWSYEDELGLLAIVYGRDCSRRTNRAIVIDQVQICNAESGEILRTFSGSDSFVVDADPYPWTLDSMVDGVNLLVSLQTRRYTYVLAYELAESRP